ncbi:MAG: hypothetical protein ACYSR6_07805 [Planctomycetota bacterium]|jgi:hypothetical protein
MPIFILHALAAVLILLVGIRVLRKRRRGLVSNFLLGWAFQVLLSIPAGLYQAIRSWPHISFGADSALLWRMVWVPLVGSPFNAAGFTVTRIFEATVRPLEWLVGHRTATVMSNVHYFWFLLAVQGCLIAVLFALRYMKKRKLLDPFIICLAVLFLINSMLNVKWFWAGT